VLEGRRIVLKWGVKVGLGEMPGVASLGKEAEVRETEFPHQALPFFQGPLVIVPLKAGMEEEKTQHDQAAHKEKNEKSG